MTLYRVQYFDSPGAFILGEWQDYVPKDLPAADAIPLRDEAQRRYPKRSFRTVTAQSPTRQDLVHAVSVVAKDHGIAIPNPARMSRPELKLAGAYVARATNHGNRRPSLNGLLGLDGQGRLVLHMGGAR